MPASRMPNGLVASVGLLLVLASTLPARAAGEFEVTAGSIDNTIRLALEPAQIFDPSVEILERPGWLEHVRAAVNDGDGAEIILHFAVADGAPIGSRGTLVARVRGDHGESIIRRWPLRISESAPPSQFSYRIEECCLAPADVQTDPRGLPLRDQLVGGAPNPWRDLTRIRFGLAGAGETVTLRVLDPAGRLVCEIRTPHLPAGFHQITWTGRDDAGRPVPAGLYLYEIRAGQWKAIGKTLLLR